MKLVRYNSGRIGVLKDDMVYDASGPLGLDPAAWPPVGMVQLIAKFPEWRGQLEAATQGAGQKLSAVKLEAPILWPNNLFAYPVNYLDHKKEMNSPNRADLNGFFLKTASSLSGPSDPIVLPDLPNREVHHECELAMIIGKRGRHIKREDALSHIFGYACLVDVTVRGKEERVMRKSYDTFCPIGPAIVTADEVRDPDKLEMKLWVNDELRQHANTDSLIVDIREMIVLASSVTTLEPGDVFATGTPGGVGRIKVGDTVTIEIESVGRMALPVVQGQGGDNLAIHKDSA